MKLFITTFLVCLSLHSVAQQRANIWYFQDYGLDFNQNPPSLLTEVAFHQNRSIGIASDANGQLLFYTDNFTAFDRAHNKMPNGKELLDPNLSGSTLQNSVVVPKPGSETIFYVFMVDPQNGVQDQSGLYYFVVDMELNNGMGDVSVRPQKLVPSTSNKLAAVLHTNRNDVWVTTHIANTNTYKTFLITSAGISAPVTTSLGSNVSSFTAQLKFSPDGTKVASSDDENINLFDFDATTGTLSNARLLILPQFLWPDAVSFSPDGTKLYAATQSVVQYDVSSGDISKIKASEKILLGYVNNLFYNFQLAPDGKIYITKGGGGGTSDYLGAITNPNESGSNANVVERYFYLQGFDSFVNWTPVFIESYFMRPDIVVENTCFNDVTKLSLSNTRYVQGVKWTLGEGEIQTAMDVQHTFSTAKTWDIEVEVDYGNQKVIVKKAVVINALPEFDLGPDQTVCEGTLLTANVSGKAFYLWNTGDTTKTLVPRSTGLYSVEAKYGSTGCKYYDEVNLVVNETPFVNLGPDSVVCKEPAYVLKSRTKLSNVEYKWNDPTVTGPELTVKSGGFYFLEAKSILNGCFHRDSVFIALKFAPEPDLGDDRTINRDQSFTLDMSGYGPGTFLWEDRSTSSVRNVYGSNLAIGSNTISLSITDTNGCIGNDEMIVTVLNIVGVEEDKQFFYFYPVPANSTLFIETPRHIDVSLIDMRGTLLTAQSIQSGTGSIDLSTYANGIYILQVKSESGTIRRFVAKN